MEVSLKMSEEGRVTRPRSARRSLSPSFQAERRGDSLFSHTKMRLAQGPVGMGCRNRV